MNKTSAYSPLPSTYSPDVSEEAHKKRKAACCRKLYNCCKVILVTLKSLLNLTNYKVTHVNVENPSKKLVKKLKKFEASFTYPFSDQERFQIEHGKDGDYFAFFKQLGKVHYYVATCKKSETVTKVIDGEEVTIKRKKGEISAVGCAVLRTLKTRSGKKIKAWYICDLKVGEKYRGEHLPIMMFQKGIWRFFQCPRGYGICMNPPDKKPRAAEIWRQHSPIKGSKTETLNLYTMSAEQAENRSEEIEDVLKEEGYMSEEQRLGFVSTAGKKDYIIFGEDEDASRSWDLLHAQPVDLEDEESNPEEDFMHMVGAVSGTELDARFEDLMGEATSTAQIVSYGMDKVDFNFLTSNQI